MANDAAPEAAILDINVRGGKIYSVAEQLLARGLPVVLASGYEEWAIPETLQGQPRLSKPFTTAELEEQVRFLCGEVAKRKRARKVG